MFLKPCYVLILILIAIPAQAIKIEDAKDLLAEYQASPTDAKKDELISVASEILEEGITLKADDRDEQDIALGKAEVALEIREELFGSDHIETINARSNLARLYTYYGWRSKADTQLVHSYNAANRILETNDPYIADLLLYLGNHRAPLGITESKRLYEQARNIYAESFGEESLFVAYTLERLAKVTSEYGSADEAIRLAKEAIRILKLQPIHDQNEILAANETIARSLALKGNYQQAISHLQKTLQDLEEVDDFKTYFGCSTDWRMPRMKRRDDKEWRYPLPREPSGSCGDKWRQEARVYSVLAEVHGMFLKDDEQKEAIRQVIRRVTSFGDPRRRMRINLGGSIDVVGQQLARSIEINGPDHPANIDLVIQLARLQDQNLNEEAIYLYEHAVSLLVKHEPLRLNLTAQLLSDMALFYWMDGDFERAEKFRKGSLQAYAKLDDVNKRDSAAYARSGSQVSQGLLLLLEGDFEEAETFYRETFARTKETRGEKHLNTLMAQLGYTNFYHSLNMTARLQEETRELARLTDLVFGNQEPLPNANLMLAVDDFLKGDVDAALRRYEALLQSNLGRSSPAFFLMLGVDLLNMARQAGRFEEGAKYYEQIMSEKKIRQLNDRHKAPIVALGADIYMEQGQVEEAMEMLERSYAALAEMPSDMMIWRITHSLAKAHRHSGNPAAAIFFGKTAVNSLQRIRSELKGFDVGSQKSFLDDKSSVYRNLADSYVEIGDIASAHRVVNMLKSAEFDDFILRSHRDENLPKVDYNDQEADAENRLEEIRLDIHRVRAEIKDLQRRKGSLDWSERRKLNKLEDTKSDLLVAFQGELEEIRHEFAQLGIDRIMELGEKNLGALGALQGVITRLGEDVAVIHYLALPDKIRMIVTTSNGSSSHETHIPSRELNDLILGLRESLDFPGDQNYNAMNRLYDLLVRPIDPTLQELGIKNLMISLDGTLRYIPFSVLHDGDEYLVEKYRLARYTPAASLSVGKAPERRLRVASFGVSQGGRGFAPLPTVPVELDEIVLEDDTDTRGVLPGLVVLDQAFTRDRFVNELTKTGEMAANVVHLATHFDFRPGKVTASTLLAGNGEAISVADFKYGKYPLTGVELLTLSACNTGLSATAADGSEIEGFAALAQNQGAAAVMSTLWSVADESTSRFMSSFYREYSSEGASKIEALQRVQSNFINSKDSSRDYSDPFYWAPFVVMGNWL